MISPDYITQLLLSALATVIALCIHEYCHGYAAYKLGDDTAARCGRLTLNPIHHIDPIGAIFMVFFRFGWAKPVPINPRNFKNPKRDFAITALAGPLSNILAALISAPIFLLFLRLLSSAAYGGFGYILLYNTALFFSILTALNIGLGVFNMIPVPPFDGSRILNALLPQRIYFKVMKYERQIYWGVIAWLFFGTYAYRALMSVRLIARSPLLSAFIKIFDLSGLIGIAIDFLYRAIISFWQLIPFLS